MVGRTLRHYRIERTLGSGGMGDVYVAEDLTLHRKVALKTISAQLAADPDALPRLEREARAVAALNHPGIVTIYSVEEADGVHYLTMELVDGRPLSQAIPADGLPLAQAIEIGLQIADALDAAHRRGIVHRDIKPANVMLARSSATQVKILDFGVAKLAQPAASGQQPTITASGLMVGTPQYMSPEQMEGHSVDHRADIFALGAVLFEMMTGRKAFDGSSAASAMAAVLTREPPVVSQMRLDAPPMLDAIVRKCLAKDPDERWQSARDLRDALRWVRDGVSAGGAVGASQMRPARSRFWLVAAAALAAGAGLAAAAMLLFGRDQGNPPAWTRAPVRFTVTATSPPRDLALSPDGRQLAYVAAGPDGATAIWVRPLDQSDARMVPNTRGAAQPFWSPDGRSLAFHADNALKRIDLDGGAPQTLCEVSVGIGGGSWGPSGAILFGMRQAIQQIPSTGGTATPVTTLDLSRQENGHRFPHFLPDGRRFLYVARSGRPEKSSVYLGSLDGSPPARLFAVLSPVRYAAPGRLLFVRDNTLVAQPFDADAGRVTGDARAVAPLVASDPWVMSAAYSVGEGVLAYRSPEPRASQLTWFDRAGRAIGTVGEPDSYSYFRISPDGRRVAADIADPRQGSRSIWIFDIVSGVRSRVTFAGSHDWIPVWSPDGSRILFSSFRDGPTNLYQKPASGAGGDTPVFISNDQKFAHDWSPDGRFAAYMEYKGLQEANIVARRIDGTGNPIAIAQNKAIEFYPRFSPDGRWIAYGSAESGRDEVYVQPFPPTGGKWQISSSGASHIRWRADGRQIFYMTGNRIVAVDVTTTSTFAVGPPRTLFQVDGAVPSTGSNTFEVAPDGKRFLINVRRATTTTDNGVTIVVNWIAGLGR